MTKLLFRRRVRESAIWAFWVLAVASTAVFAASGDLDTSFTASAHGTTNGTISVVKRLADGRILVGGYFTEANGVAATSIARLNADGTIDPTFNTQNLFAAFGIGSSVNSIAVQADGKILVGGYFYSQIGEPQPGLRRLNSNGSLDITFNTFGIFGGRIDDIEIQADNRIVIGGEFTGPSATQNIARLNANGTVDNSFSSVAGLSVRDLEIQPDGNILIGGFLTGDTSSGVIKRLTTNGSVDGTFLSFLTNGSVEALKVKSNGQILIGGTFSSVNGFSQGRLSLLNADGSLDLTFNQNNPGAGGGFSVAVRDIELASDGKVIIGGRFLSFNGVSRTSVARLNTDGQLDNSFQNNTVLADPSTVYDVALQTDDKVIVGASFGPYSVTVRRFNSDATPDTGFAPIFSITGRVNKVLPLSDGKTLIGGEFPFFNGVKRNGLVRLNSNGTLDTGFVPYLNSDASQRSIIAIATQPDGKVLIGIAGVDQVIRLNADGTKDASFTTPFFGPANDIIVLTNGQILAGGSFGLRRLNSNGSNDGTFVAQPNGAVNKIVIQANGRIMIGGAFTQVGAVIRGRIARLNETDGSLDATFNPPGGANGIVNDFDLQSDGKVVLGGEFTSLNGAQRLRVGRLLPDGSLDATFVQVADGSVRAVKVQPDDKVLIGGSMAYVQGQSQVGFARLNANGTLDPTMTAHPNTSVYDIGLQADNKILLTGEFILVNGLSAVRVARLLNSVPPARTLFDYDGDGRADVSVFRASTNRWYVLKSSDMTVYEMTFGLAGDVIAPADYDGDGKTDLGIFRSGAWWYLSSVDGQQKSGNWGSGGDVPRPSDFDGDGIADLIVFRPSENKWYRMGSSGLISIVSFGLAGDQPVTGDFDGDGKSDIAIYRPSDGNWWWQSSVDGIQRATKWGISTDMPTPADYDGDGKTDFAVFRPSTGVWYIINSSNGSFLIGPFGTPGDKPVAGDYDGDGKADIAIFRPSTGIWHLLRSTSGYTGYQFGISTDIPTENAFVP